MIKCTFSCRPQIAVVTAALLSACNSLSGLGGSDQYGCKAPAGVKCESVSGTYYNALQNNLPSQRPRQPLGAALSPASAPASSPSRDGAPPTMTAAAVAARSVTGYEGAANRSERSRPLRTEARILRLWIKAYEDSDRDLHDQGYVFVQIDSGRWLVEHAQRQAREAYAPVRPPRAPAARSDQEAGSAVARPTSPEDGAWPALQSLRGVQGGRSDGK